MLWKNSPRRYFSQLQGVSPQIQKMVKEYEVSSMHAILKKYATDVIAYLV